MTDVPNPVTRKEQYLSYLTGNATDYPKGAYRTRFLALPNMRRRGKQ